MTFPPPLELSLIGLHEAGVPGQEKIVLRPTESINLAQFGILVGWKGDTGLTTPLNDNFFWFGEIVVPVPSWIVVFTGKGTFYISKHPQNGQPIYVFYWGREQTVFHHNQFVPVVFQMSTVLIGNNVPAQIPQKT
jgi:hypothetical protein